MQWLHFSDFHFGRKQGAQAEAMGSLIDFIRNDFAKNPGKIDVVLLAGDIAYGGLKEEYQNFATDKLMTGYFNNSVKSMFSYFVNKEKIDLKEADEIMKLIENLKNK